MTSPTRDSLVTTQEIVAHLWRRRLILMVVPCLAVVGGYLLARMYGDIYRSGAVLLIRMPAGLLREGPRFQDFTPPAYADLLASDDMLFSVIEEVRKSNPEYKGRFEDLKKGFSVKTVMTRETVTTAEYAPTLELEVNAGSPEVVQKLAETWMNKSIERFGSLRTREVGQIANVFTEKFDTIANQAQALQEKEAKLERTVQTLDTVIGGNNRIIGGLTSDGVIIDQNNQSDNARINPYQNLGVIHERAMLELDLAEATPERAVQLKARIAAIDAMVPKVLEKIEEMGKARIEAQRDLENVRDQLLMIKGGMDQTRLVLAGSTADATAVPDKLDPKNVSDFSVLARPVKPEKRIGPPRALIGLGSGVAIGALLVVLFVLEVYIKRAVSEEAA